MPEIVQKLSTLRSFVEDGIHDGVLKEKQNSLIRQLRHKFEAIPDEIIELIQETTDSDQLEEWQLEFVTADTLEELFPDVVPA